MTAYYNEHDAYAAAWLRNLIRDRLIAPGDVDERSIVDVQPGDLAGYEQCHFFAGIGGWSYALRLAGISDDRSLWTGSCPCQPFSSAGKQGGSSDERHLWPAWFRLIRECRPDRIFGEQVEGAVGFGWIDRVFADLEDEGYACGAAVLGAHSVGAPHIRQRLYWLADAGASGRGVLQRSERADGRQEVEPPRWGDTSRPCPVHPASCGRTDCSETWCVARDGLGNAASEQVGRARQPWSHSVWLPCTDGRARRIEPGIQPLVTGLPVAVDGLGTVSRVGTLRGAGNAICPQVATAFIRAYLGE